MTQMDDTAAGATPPAVPQALYAAKPGTGGGGCCPPVVSPSSSRRRRLWELDEIARCSVISVGLPMAALRRLVDMGPGSVGVANDQASQCAAIAACRTHTPLAEHIHQALDVHHVVALQRAARQKTEQDLAAWWQTQTTGHDLPGALWALLTHPRCTPSLEDRTLGEVHMLQHRLGAATRADTQRLADLADENHVLGRQLARAQALAAQQAAEHARETDALQRLIVRLRAEALLRTTEAQGLRADLQRLRETTDSRPVRSALADENRRLQARLQAQQCRVARMHDELLQRRVPAQHSAAAPAWPRELDRATPPPEAAPPAAQLPGPPRTLRAVLCVGGHSASVPAYRQLIEDTGGRFLHHDGGAEDSAARLDATLAAADLVICQTGCISHDAYWRVKDHCKRTGKRCVHVETPSLHALAQALTPIEPPGEDTGSAATDA